MPILYGGIHQIQNIYTSVSGKPQAWTSTMINSEHICNKFSTWPQMTHHLWSLIRPCEVLVVPLGSLQTFTFTYTKSLHSWQFLIIAGLWMLRVPSLPLSHFRTSLKPSLKPISHLSLVLNSTSAEVPFLEMLIVHSEVAGMVKANNSHTLFSLFWTIL